VHAHGIGEDADTKRLGAALALIAGFMAVEVVVGILVHSLALLSDAAHMLTDAAALLMSLWVIRLVKRPSGGNLTFGLKRSEILSAQANGGTLLVLAGLIVYEGVHRLVSPPAAGGLAILIVGLVAVWRGAPTPWYARLVLFYCTLNTYFLLFGFIYFSDRLAAYSWTLAPLVLATPFAYPKAPVGRLLTVLFVIAVLAFGFTIGPFQQMTGIRSY